MKKWPTKALGEICQINPKLATSEVPAGDAQVTFIPMSAIDENNGVIVCPESRRYAEVAKGYTPFKENDVLFAKITPCMQNGKAAIVSNLCGMVGFGSTEYHVLRPSTDVLSKWIFAFVRQQSFRIAAEASFTGTAGQQRVPVDFIKNVSIPVPPLAEQERIVKLLDEADELRKLRAQSDRRTSDLISALFNEMFGDPATNTHQWPKVVLGDVIFAAKDGPHVSPKYSLSGVPFLSTRHVKQGQVIWEDLKFLSDKEAILHWNKCKPEKGDVLYTKGGTTGVAAAVTFDTPIAVWVHIALLKTNHEKVDPIWLENMLNSNYCHQQSQELTHGITNRDLGLTRMVKIKMYLPQLTLQKEFARRVTEIHALESSQSSSRKRLDDLFQSLLHRAFNGDI